MKKKHVVIATGILVLLVVAGWLFLSGEDAEVLEAKQMRADLVQRMDDMSPEERRAGFDALREKTRNFTAGQRRELGRGRQQMMMQRAERILAMSPQEQKAELDKIIDGMAKRRQGREGRAGRNGAGRDGRGRGRGGGKSRLDNSTPQMRASRDAMRDLINDRREERGMEPISGRWR